MKNSYFIGTIIFCMLTLHANGQSSVGVKADVNLSNMWITKSTNIKTSMKAGGSAGFFYKYKWHELRGVQADMFLRYRTSDVKNLSSDKTSVYHYVGIELPVYSTIQVEFDDQLFYMGFGPFASFGLYSRSQSNDRHINLYKKDPIYNKSPVRRWDFGMGLIIGYEMRCRLQFNFNAQFGLRNKSGYAFENVDLISQMVGLGVGYRF